MFWSKRNLRPFSLLRSKNLKLVSAFLGVKSPPFSHDFPVKRPVKWVKSSKASYRSEMAKQFAQHLEHLRGYVAESLGFWADGGDGHGKLEVTMEIWWWLNGI